MIEEDLPDITEPLGKPVIITEFVGDEHAINVVTRRSHTGILLFINNYLIMSFINRYNTVESSTFGLELVSMKITLDNVVKFMTNCKSTRVTLSGSSNVCCDNQGVVKNISVP